MPYLKPSANTSFAVAPGAGAAVVTAEQIAAYTG